MAAMCWADDSWRWLQPVSGVSVCDGGDGLTRDGFIATERNVLEIGGLL